MGTNQNKTYAALTGQAGRVTFPGPCPHPAGELLHYSISFVYNIYFQKRYFHGIFRHKTRTPKSYITMKHCYLLLGSFLIAVSVNANCTNAYSQASYGLAHSKKALSANNFDHQVYYAERALTAFEKAETLALDCGCASAETPIMNGLDNLRKAIAPKDWEMGRYYTKKAVADAQNLMAALDLCTSGGDTPSVPEVSYISPEVGEDLKNPEELEAQLLLKRVAELTLFEYQKSVRELAGILGCENALQLAETLAERSESELEEETLEATRRHYLEQSIGLQRQVLQAFSECSGAVSGTASLDTEP